MRISQAAKILNVGIGTLIKDLAEIGYKVEMNPNAHLSQEVLSYLAKSHQSKELANFIDRTNPKPFVETPSKNVMRSPPQNSYGKAQEIDISGLKVIGRIDLSSKVDKVATKKSNQQDKSSAPPPRNVLQIIEEKRKRIGLPKYIYKYNSINEYLFKSLRENYLYFNQPDNFNDPFDCSPNLISYYDNYEEYSAHLRNKKDPLAATINTELFEIIKHSKRSSLGDSMKSAGVCCFSRKPLNILMWSHYAQSHCGICLEFSYNSDNIIKSAVDVHYSDEFICTNFDISPEIALGNMIYTKAKDWEYEQELRIYKLGFHKPADRMVNFSKKALTGIIFGLKCKSEAIQNIKDIVSEAKYPDVKYYKTVFDNGKFSLNKVAIEP